MTRVGSVYVEDAQAAAPKPVGETVRRILQIVGEVEVRTRADELEEQAIPDGVLNRDEALKVVVEIALAEVGAAHRPVLFQVVLVGEVQAQSHDERAIDATIEEAAEASRCRAPGSVSKALKVDRIDEADGAVHATFDVRIHHELGGSAKAVLRRRVFRAVLLGNRLTPLESGLQLEESKVDD